MSNTARYSFIFTSQYFAVSWVSGHVIQCGALTDFVYINNSKNSQQVLDMLAERQLDEIKS